MLLMYVGITVIRDTVGADAAGAAGVIIIGLLAIAAAVAVYEALDPGLVIWDEPAPPLQKRWRRELKVRGVKFAARAGVVVYVGGLTLFVGYFLVLIVGAALPPTVAFVFRDAQPQVAAAIVGTFGLVMVTILTIFGGRLLESRRAARERQARDQAPVYGRLVRMVRGLRLGDQMDGPDWVDLRDSLVVVGSNKVLEKFSEVATKARKRPEEHVRSAERDLREAKIQLFAALRSDLGFWRGKIIMPLVWRDITDDVPPEI
ncbi:MAG: hypothetical protein QOE90_811 [Thermoplasmata archaeon]|jgi:hypothetical protein|nr:hypothetical protein [Thermoplasmata archaeon]